MIEAHASPSAGRPDSASAPLRLTPGLKLKWPFESVPSWGWGRSRQQRSILIATHSGRGAPHAVTTRPCTKDGNPSPSPPRSPRPLPRLWRSTLPRLFSSGWVPALPLPLSYTPDREPVSGEPSWRDPVPCPCAQTVPALARMNPSRAARPGVRPEPRPHLHSMFPPILWAYQRLPLQQSPAHSTRRLANGTAWYRAVLQWSGELQTPIPLNAGLCRPAVGRLS